MSVERTFNGREKYVKYTHVKYVSYPNIYIYIYLQNENHKLYI